MPPGFHAQDTEAALFAMEGDPLDNPSQDFCCAFSSCARQSLHDPPNGLVADPKQGSDFRDGPHLYVPHSTHLGLLRR